MKNPYTLTTVIFVIIAFIGAWFLGWRDENFAFILLLYFIVALGIKLDEISGQIGPTGPDRKYPVENNDNILRQMAKINTSLATLNHTLNKFVEKKQTGQGLEPEDHLSHSYEKKDYRPEDSEK
jgi:hypothetical protein